MRTRLSLIVQDGVMIPQGETPVLEFDFTHDGNLRLIPQTVRFLRCGCPSVQWMITTTGIPRFPKEDVIDVFATIKGGLSKLQIDTESLSVEAPLNWQTGTVLTFTRTVGQMTNLERVKELLPQLYRVATELSHEVRTPGSLPIGSEEWTVSVGVDDIRTALECAAVRFGFEPYYSVPNRVIG